jgi:hypothetical protein
LAVQYETEQRPAREGKSCGFDVKPKVAFREGQALEKKAVGQQPSIKERLN